MLGEKPFILTKLGTNFANKLLVSRLIVLSLFLLWSWLWFRGEFS